MQSATLPLFGQFQIVPVPSLNHVGTAEFHHLSLPGHLLTEETIAHLIELISGHSICLNCLTTTMRILDQDDTGDVMPMWKERIQPWCQHPVEMAQTKERRRTPSEVSAPLKRMPGEAESYLGTWPALIYGSG